MSVSRSWSHSSFPTQHLYRYVGSSILVQVYQYKAVLTGALMRPYGVDLYAANGKTAKTSGLADCVKFQLGGNELEINFVIVDDAMGVEDFLLERKFLRTYQGLVDLTAMKVIVVPTPD